MVSLGSEPADSQNELNELPAVVNVAPSIRAIAHWCPLRLSRTGTHGSIRRLISKRKKMKDAQEKSDNQNGSD